MKNETKPEKSPVPPCACGMPIAAVKRGSPAARCPQCTQMLKNLRQALRHFLTPVDMLPFHSNKARLAQPALVAAQVIEYGGAQALVEVVEQAAETGELPTARDRHGVARAESAARELLKALAGAGVKPGRL